MPSRLGRAVALSAALSATTGALAVLGSAPVAAAPGTGDAVDGDGTGPSSTDTAGARALLDDTVVEAGRAVEEYNRVSERVGELTTEVERLRDRLARDREQVNRKREALGGIAGAQYRSGGMDPSLALLLSPDPDAYLVGAAALERLSGRQAEELRELRRLLRGMEQRREETVEAVEELEERRTELARRKQEVQRKLAGARSRLERLAAEEEEGRERASRTGERGDPGGPVSETTAPVSGRAASAVVAARNAVGRPYVWGANGPHGFDCSGLTQWAWAQAGASLPRTSQAQAGAGRRVDAASIQPGDVVVYRPDAGHVGLYVGGGRVVHAPYPGANVREDPLGMMPISAVVRP
ncbi:NlpC/P60 family protein [Streptomyces sp. ST2-7A]|uniref:C40 family peptidase n=1 Tax=Streptomyces sp. ST2-7A TaxID=2907214 RepID=UPI001F312B43|nr:C40 family peptidase [Streptomyces sp. ST2-7A]MCE7083307.1 C40 family peptidase [Streptomyces sp. ST2-7A]